MNFAVSAATPHDKFPVASRVTHRGLAQQVVGVMTAGALTREFLIPRRDHRHKTGYQRDPSTSRINKLAQDLQLGRVDLPTAVLINIRDFDPDVHLLEEGGQLYLRPADTPLYVVDGQHRIAALQKLVERDPDRWVGFEIPVCCMLGASEREEMEQFYVVNSTAKNVRTDLALDLLKQRAETDPEVMKTLVERGESWKVEAQAITEDLAQTEVWRNRIRFPSEPPAGTTITSSSMVSSLKKVLATPYFGAVTRVNQVRILDAYWRAVRNILTEAFADPTDYALQKGTGALVLHTLLISVLEHIRSDGKPVTDPQSYEDLLRDPLLHLEGDTTEGGVATGVGFWKAGPDGAAGAYSSNAGQRVLTARLKSTLPDLDVD